MANDLEQKIIRQIEYYFGDYNLSKDKFLLEKVKEDDEGWVEIDVLLTFKRLASLTTDKEVIAKALKKSENGIVNVNEEGTKVRRDPGNPLEELTEERKKEIMGRTAYAKGFPLDESLDDIMSFLEPHGPVISCAKRTYLDKATKEQNFKGSCFIVFKDLENCKKFIEAESIKYKDTELVRKWQTAYIDEKRQEIQDRKNKRKKKKKEDRGKVEEPPKLTFPKGAILHFTGITDEQVLTREEIKNKVAEINESEPAYIDYNKGDKEGYVRMPKENGAVEFCKKLTDDGLVEVGDAKLTFKTLEGEVEDAYLQKTIEVMANRRQFQKKGRKNHKRKSFNDDDAPKSKRAKV